MPWHCLGEASGKLPASPVNRPASAGPGSMFFFAAGRAVWTDFELSYYNIIMSVRRFARFLPARRQKINLNLQFYLENQNSESKL